SPPVQLPTAAANPVNSTSFISVPYAFGTSFNSSLVSSSLISTTTRFSLPLRFPPPSLSTGTCPTSFLSSISQYLTSSSFTHFSPYSLSFLPHSLYDVVFNPKSISSPRLFCSYPLSISSIIIRQLTPSTTRWCTAINSLLSPSPIPIIAATATGPSLSLRLLCTSSHASSNSLFLSPVPLSSIRLIPSTASSPTTSCLHFPPLFSNRALS